MWTRYIYVVGPTENPVKIGVADDPAKRMRSLQMGAPDKLVLHHAVGVPFKHGHYVETATHKALAEHHRHGEWFNIDANEARKIIVAMADKVAREYLRSAIEDDNILIRAEALHDMTPNWRNVVKMYQRIKSRDGAKKLLARVQGDIVSATGREGLTVFETAIVNPGTMEQIISGNEKAMRKAERLAAAAMNAAERSMSLIHNAALPSAEQALDEFQRSMA
jgi:hypothetical protein